MKNERMKKWIASAVFTLLGMVVIGYSIKLAYDVMAILFPNDPVLKFMAIALYDGGVIGWLLAYTAKAKGTPQRGISLLMTVLDFIGVAAMAIAGIYLGGQTLADVPPWVGGLVVVATIIATVLNAGAYYFYHANDPQTLEEIQAQELEDDLNEEALDQARIAVNRKAQELGNILANRVTARMKYRLRLPMTEREQSEWQGETIDAEAYDPAALPAPPQPDPGFMESLKSFFGGKRSRQSSVTQPLKNSIVSQQDLETVTVEKANDTWRTSEAIMAWTYTPENGRERVWCRVCKTEGKPWMTPVPCEHVLTAEPEAKLTTAEAMNTLRVLMSEEKVESQ